MQTVLIIAVTVLITCILILILDGHAIIDWEDAVGFLIVISILVLVGCGCFALGQHWHKGW